MKKFFDAILKKPQENPEVETLIKDLDEQLSFKLIIDQNIHETIKTLKLDKTPKEVMKGVIGRSIGYKPYKNGILGLFTLKKGETFPYHRHTEAEALWIIDGKMKELKTGRILKKWDAIYIPSNQVHAVKAISECTYFLVWENLS